MQTQKDYQILKQIGQGLSSDIYKGIRKDKESNFTQLVTIKVYKSANFRKKFQIELKNLSRIQSVGIPKVLDWDFDQENPIIVMDYIDGCDLQQYIEVMGEDKSQALSHYIVSSIHESLLSLHEGGLCHGDLKPSNVLLSVDGTVKLIDICLDDHSHIYATPEFSAPEVLSGHRPNHKSDLYSLGVIAKELGCRGMDNLLHIKPGLRNYKKHKKLFPPDLQATVAQKVLEIKYGGIKNKKLQTLALSNASKDFGNGLKQTLDLHSVNLSYQPVPANLQKSKTLTWQDFQSTSQKLPFKMLASTFFLFSLGSSQPEVIKPKLSILKFRSLKSFEVWDQGKWNGLPYNFVYTLQNKQEQTAVKLRSSVEKNKFVTIKLHPYASKTLDVDKLQ